MSNKVYGKISIKDIYKMFNVSRLDDYFDPPEFPTCSLCDWCGEKYDNGDLTKRNDHYICDECATEIGNDDDE